MPGWICKRATRLARGWGLAAAVGQLGACHCAGDAPEPSPSVEASSPSDPHSSSADALPAWGRALSASGPKAAELQRDPDDPKLREALDSETRPTRERAVWSLARIGGEAALEQMLLRVNAAESSPAELAAVAFLEPPAAEPSEPPSPTGAWQTLEDAVWTRYAVTEDPQQAEALLLAAARIGGQSSQRRLAADLQELPSTDELVVYQAGMQAMAILCARGHALQREGLRAVGIALAASPRFAAPAAYALGRCAAVSAEQLAGKERGALVERLEPLLAGEPELARLAWSALAGLGEIPTEVPASILAVDGPPSWGTEVEAVRALSGHADGRAALVERLILLPPEAITGTRVHVVLEALRGLRDAVVGSPELLQTLQPWAERVDGAATLAAKRPAKELALVRCELSLLQTIGGGELEDLTGCAVGVDGLPTAYGDRLAVEALLRMGGEASRQERLEALLQRAADPRGPVAAAACSALADLDDARVNQVLVEALGRDDAGVQAAAAGAIAARAVDAARRDPEAIPALVRLVTTARDVGRLEARLAAIEALGSLARSAPDSAPAPWLETVVLPLGRAPHAAVRKVAREALLGRDDLLARFDEATPEQASFDPRVQAALDAFESAPARGLRVRTDAGEFTIDFEGAPARMAQAVLVSLARDGYFDGLTFHRVVPDFVIQGGDPRGDGYGGPGFVIPCERSNVRYERGTVGMALAGKDTGGSQFFVTHAPQPHLDGRYPVIGRIAADEQDVVDAVLPHDRIVKVEVLPLEPAP